jgi:hypothetical protein
MDVFAKHTIENALLLRCSHANMYQNSNNHYFILSL